MSSFNQSIISNIDSAQKCTACIASYAEYAKSKLTDISDWISNTSSTDAVSIPIEGVSGYSGYGIMSLLRSEYESAIEGASTVTLYTPSDTTIEVNGADVLDAFNTQLSELRIQSLFLDYCQSKSDNLQASEFLTRIQSFFSDAVPAVIEKYSNILDKATNSIDAYYAFFQLTSNQPTMTNNYIKLVDGSQYTGSVWNAVALTIGQQVSSFFTGLWDKILNMKEFFAEIIDGAKKLIKWAISKMFKNLTTVYEVQGSDPTQLMDLPLMQVDLGTYDGTAYNNVSQLLSHIAAQDTDGFIYPLLRNNICFKPDAQTVPIATAQAFISSFINRNATVELVSGTEYAVLHDVVIPTSPLNLLCRIGRTEDNHIILVLYACFTKGLIDSMEDDEIFSLIIQSVDNLPIVISGVCPWGVRCEYTHFGTKAINYRGKILNPIYDPENPSEYTTLFLSIKNNMFSINLRDVLDNEILPSAGTSGCSKHEVIASLILYSFFMGKQVIDPYYGHFQEKAAQVGLRLWDNSSATDVYTEPYTEGLYSSGIFIPYLKSNPAPFSIHYQTTQEQADELVKLVWGVVIAIAVIYVTAKAVKWSKNRKINTQLAQAAMDSSSWDYATNPTAENLQTFLNARKKYNRMNVVNKILGLASSTSDVSNLVLPQLDSSDRALISLIKG